MITIVEEHVGAADPHPLAIAQTRNGVGLGLTVAGYRHDGEGHARALAEPIAITGRKIAVYAALDGDAFADQLDRLGDGQPAVLRDPHVAVEFADPLLGLKRCGAEREDERRRSRPEPAHRRQAPKVTLGADWIAGSASA